MDKELEAKKREINSIIFEGLGVDVGVEKAEPKLVKLLRMLANDRVMTPAQGNIPESNIPVSNQQAPVNTMQPQQQQLTPEQQEMRKRFPGAFGI